MTTLRVVRDTVQGKKVKKLYKYCCQICRETLAVASGPYAEAAHIRPLGSPHDGPDTRSNILCLCPNHHVLFDRGGFTINDDLSLNGLDGRLYKHPQHDINKKHIQYHRQRYSD